MKTLSKKIMLMMSLFLASVAFTACSSSDDDGGGTGSSPITDGPQESTAKCLVPAFSESKLRWGFINENGEFVIAPQFYDAEMFDAELGIARVYTENGKCFIDSLGNIKTLPVSFDDIMLPPLTGNPFLNGLALVNKDGLYGLVNTNFDYVIQPQYKDIIPMSLDGETQCYISPDGFIKCIENGKYGYINTKGETVLDFKYESLGDISENGLIACGRSIYHQGMSGLSTVYHYINIQGKTVINPSTNFYGAGQFHNGVAIVNTSNAFGLVGNYGLINERGAYVVSPQYGSLSYIGDNRYIFAKYDEKRRYLYGIIDSSGKEIKPATYYRIGNFTDDGVAVAETSLNGKYGYIDKNGNVVIDFLYKYANEFNNGYAEVTNIDDTRLLINKSGDVVMTLQENETAEFRSGLFFINSYTESESSGRLESRYVNLLGKTVYSWSLEGDKIYE